MKLAFLQGRALRIGGTLLLVILLLAAGHYGVPFESPIGWILDLFGAGFMLFVGLALISQFTLPVTTWDERLQAVSRIFNYAFGDHGPVVFVRDGILIASKAELRRGGAGVILVDSASAVVLEKGMQFSRAEGPGLVFMQPGERILAALDLRKQRRVQPTAALTKDGIEVKTTVSVTFGLASGGAGAGGSEAGPRLKRPYPFDAKSAFKAVYGGAVGKDNSELKWTDLPINFAVEAFRNLLSRQTLDDLFRPTDPATFPLQDFGRKLTEEVRDAPILVDRGIQVFSASAGAFELPKEVQKQRIASWEADWKKRAQLTLGAGTVQAEKIKYRARSEAQAEVTAALRTSLQSLRDGNDPEVRQQMITLIMETMRHLATSHTARRVSVNEAFRVSSYLSVLMDAPQEELQQLLAMSDLPISLSPLAEPPAGLPPHKPPAEPGDGPAPEAGSAADGASTEEKS